MDLTNFNFRHHNLQLEVLEGDLCETVDGIFPLTHIILFNDDYCYVLKHTFIGFKMYDEHDIEHIVTGKDMADRVLLRIEAKGRVDLTQWEAASDALLATMGINA